MPGTSPDRFSLSRLLPILLVLVAVIALSVLVGLASRDPVVVQITPEVVEAGREVVVSGRYFGDFLGQVSIGGREIPSSAILRWEDQEIRFEFPSTATSGLLHVITERGRSDGVLVQAAGDLPRSAGSGEPGAPVIGSLADDRASVGMLLTIQGENFGANRRGAGVVFTTQGNRCLPCDSDIYYPLWTDNQIVVRVPHGAVNGLLRVRTPWGESNPVRITIERPVGDFVLSDRHEIGLQYRVTLSDVKVAEPAGRDGTLPGESDIVIHLPLLLANSAQRNVRVIYAHSLGRVEKPDSRPVESVRYEHPGDGFTDEIVRTVILDRYAIRADVDPSRMTASYEGESAFFPYYTRSLPHLPVEDDRIQEIAAGLRRNRANPYRIAEAAYAYTLENLEYAVPGGDRSALAGLAQGYGDDYTYATLFTTLVRAARVPARVVGGVVFTQDNRAYPHFWSEFFVTSVGWIPVDPGFGDGGFPGNFPVVDDPAGYYFGGLDALRVTFQAGYDSHPPADPTVKLISPEDPFSLGAVYAELGSRVDSATVAWHEVRPTGIYRWSEQTSATSGEDSD